MALPMYRNLPTHSIRGWSSYNSTPKVCCVEYLKFKNNMVSCCCFLLCLIM